MKIIQRGLRFLGLILVSLNSFAQPTNVQVDIVTDALVISGATYSNTNFGSATNFGAFYTDTRRTYLQADLTGIPANAIITSATLYLNAYSVNNGAAHPMYLSRLTPSTSWSESTITWNNQPSSSAFITSDQITFTDGQTNFTGWQTFNILSHVQYMVNYPNLNKGWVLRLQSESGTTRGVAWYSSDYNTLPVSKPKILITYVLPIEVDGLVHHCTAGQNDGFVDNIVITEGSETYASYEWFKYDMGTVTSIESGTNMANVDISGLADGLYLLRVTDNGGLVGYKYFIVGEYGATTTVDFRNNSSTANSQIFNEDACPSYAVSAGDGTTKTGNATYMYAYNTTTVYTSILLNYKVDFDPLFDVSVANLRLYSMGHYTNASPATTDSGYVSRATSSWEEGTVTWNTKPTITSTDRQLIPPTSPAGSVTRHDTIDLKPFVEYWQQNPEENYGIDLSLTQYGQAATAYLRYRSYDYSTATQRPSFLLTFSLPEQVTTDFVDSLGTGSISLVAPNGELPYKYLISAIDTLPVLDTLWYAIKDSIAIDSASFYQGQFNTHFHTFDNLPADRYFIAVYDNNGDKIFDHQVYVKPPLRLADTTDIIIDGDTLFVDYPTASSARAVYFDAISLREDGGMEIEITQLDDDIIVGFNNLEEPKVVYEGDFEYAVKIESSGDVTFLRDGSSLGTTTAIVGDQFRMVKLGNDINFYKNGTLEYSDALRDTQLDDFKTEIHLKGPGSSLVSKPVGKFGPTPKHDIQHAICGEHLGTLTIQPGSFHGYSLYGYSLINIQTLGVFTSGSISSTAITINDIPVGIYNLKTYWTNGSTSFSSTTEVVIGYLLNWVDMSNITAASYPLNTISPTNTSTPATAKSLNTIEFDHDYWLQFQNTFPIGESSWTYFEIKNTDGDLEGGIVILRTLYNTYAAFYSQAGFELLESGVPYAISPYAVELNGGAPLRILQSGGEITIQYQNTDLVIFDSSVDGLVMADVTMYGDVLLTNAIASFCYPIASPYVKLRRIIDGGYYLANEGILNVEYDEEYNDDELEFYVYKESGNDEVGETSWTISPVSYGDNRLSFSFIDTTCLANGYYILEIVNKKNEKRYLRFKIVNSTC